MKKNVSKHLLLITICLLSVIGCKVKQTAGAAQTEAKTTAGPHAIVYRTKGDCSAFVPVTMATDRSQITSYPAPTDIFRNGKLALPTALVDGYYLDNRGINIHSVFVRISYEEYSRYKTAPELEELTNLIIDLNPFKEMYDLGPRSRFVSETNEINAIIKSGQLENYKKLL